MELEEIKLTKDVSENLKILSDAFNKMPIKMIAIRVEHLQPILAEIERLREDVNKWIKLAGENQRSANKSANWAEDAEARIRELTKLDESMCSRLDAANDEIAALKERIVSLESKLCLEARGHVEKMEDNRKLREALEKALPIMEKVSRYDSYHQEWKEQEYENAPPEEVILRAVKIAKAALGGLYER